MRFMCILAASLLGELLSSSPAEALPLGNKAVSRMFTGKPFAKRSPVGNLGIPGAISILAEHGSDAVRNPVATATTVVATENAIPQRAKIASASEHESTARTMVDTRKNTETNLGPAHKAYGPMNPAADVPQNSHEASHAQNQGTKKVQKQKDSETYIEKQRKEHVVKMQKIIAAQKAHDPMKKPADLAQKSHQAAHAQTQADAKKSKQQNELEAHIEKQSKEHVVDLNLQKAIAAQKAHDIAAEQAKKSHHTAHAQTQADAKNEKQQKELEAHIEKQRKEHVVDLNRQKAIAVQKAHYQMKKADEDAKKLNRVATYGQTDHAVAAGVTSHKSTINAKKPQERSKSKAESQTHWASSTKLEKSHTRKEAGTKKKVAQMAGKATQAQDKWKKGVKSLVQKVQEMKKQKKRQRMRSMSEKRVARIGGYGDF